ncbi:hypothetical protein CRX69_22440 [Pseudomonas rhizophila]|uniref:Secreted protein n=1 Tax=Pseudomonas rhizophila TaxID=2045200 RepID=A0ABM6UJV8_9PSED|nr:hypothetical protein CRX69_22440 [Pseudomonas rhizophila]MBD0706095.1 hypothetical protein [Pseudomonas sp. PSB1]
MPLWRGSLLPLGCAAAPRYFASATHSSGSKLPRHEFCVWQSSGCIPFFHAWSAHVLLRPTDIRRLAPNLARRLHP